MVNSVVIRCWLRGFYCFILFAIIWFDELWLLLFDLWLLVVCVYRCGTQLTTF